MTWQDKQKQRVCVTIQLIYGPTTDHDTHPPMSKIKQWHQHKPNTTSYNTCCFLWQVMDYYLPCALEGHNWEPEDRHPHPAAPVEGATGSQPNRTVSFLAGQMWAPAWDHGARLPHPHASDLPRVQANAAACTPRTRSPASRLAAGFLSPRPTEPQWTHATWCPWGKLKKNK